MNRTRRTTILFATVLATLVVACGGGGSTPTTSPGGSVAPSPLPSPLPSHIPSPSPNPTPTTGTTHATSPAQAAALVFASDPRWAAIVPLRADVIGASMWFESTISRDGGFSVDITAGAGDCQAGCIDQHTWHYFVDADGNVTLESEEGDDVAPSPPSPSDDPSEVRVALTAGPVCPVERDPPDPACAPRAVANATVTIFAADGTEFATATSDEDGTVAFAVPAGAYYIVGQQVEGLMGTPEPQAFSTAGGDTVSLQLAYDTGIR